MQEPIEVQVGRSRYVTRLTGSKRRKTLTRDKFYYVPLLETLKQLVQIEFVRNEILSRPSNNDANLHDLSDGSVFKEHEFFNSNHHALQIVAFYDEVESCNPLGSSAGKFKLGCVFFTLANIRPMFRSSLKSIFLAIIAKSSIIKKEGIDSILKPFLDDLKALRNEGINVKFAGQNEVWKGTLLAFLADNLASHELGGFKESFSFARRFCRSCLTDKNLSQSHFNEKNFTLRDSVSHKNLCSRLHDIDGASISVEFGINRCSSLDSLPNFSVAENLPHDIMHDLFEGVVPHELKLFMQYCVGMSYFSIPTLNHRIAAFDFGYSGTKDKPNLIDSEFRCKQTASQMWLLARTFPLIIGDLIPEENANWDCLLKLFEICKICTAPALSEDTAAYLELLIEEHHGQFKKLYITASIIPKMHFLVHYPRQILRFGPLIQTWTMRNEAKLRIMKRAARISNFKNVCLSAAKRHQHLVCFYIQSDSLFQMKIDKGKYKQHHFTFFPSRVQCLLTDKYGLTEQSSLSTLSFVTCNGIMYKPDALLLLSYNAMEPTFGKIGTVIITDSEEIIFVLTIYLTRYYDNHYMAFCVSETDTFAVRSVSSLSFNNIFHLRRTFAQDNKLYVNTRHFIES